MPRPAPVEDSGKKSPGPGCSGGGGMSEAWARAAGAGIPLVSLLLLLGLLALTPYAMSFEPYAGIYEEGVAATDHTADTLWGRRVALVAFGLVATGVAEVEFLRVFRRRPRDLFAVVAAGAVLLAVAVLGWRSYPYWATGVYRVCERGEFTFEFDPKSLIPMVWVGELWRMPVVLLYPVVPFVALYGLIIAGCALFRRRAAPALVILFAIGVAALFFVDFSPDYMTWLMD